MKNKIFKYIAMLGVMFLTSSVFADKTEVENIIMKSNLTVEGSISGNGVNSLSNNFANVSITNNINELESRTNDWNSFTNKLDKSYTNTVNSLSNNYANINTAITNNQNDIVLYGPDASVSNQFVNLGQVIGLQGIIQSYNFWSGSNSTILVGAKSLLPISSGTSPLATNTISIASNNQYIAYCTLPLGVTSLKAGVYTININMWKGATGTVLLSAELYIRQTNGTEIELTAVSGTQPQTIGTTLLEYIYTTTIASNYTLNATDSLLIKFKSSGVGSSPTVRINGGVFQVPIPSGQYVLQSQLNPEIVTNIATSVNNYYSTNWIPLYTTTNDAYGYGRIVIDASLGDKFFWDGDNQITNDVTPIVYVTPTNGVDMQKITICFKQGASIFTLFAPSTEGYGYSLDFPENIGNRKSETTAGGLDYMGLIKRPLANVWDIQGWQKGFGQ